MIAEESKPSFFSFFITSLVLHILAVSFFYVKKSFSLKEDIIIKSSVRVDMIDLPEKVKESRVKKVTKPKPKKKKKKSLKKKAKSFKKNSFEEDAFSSLDDLPEDEPQPKKTKPSRYAGNKITKGTDLKGLDRVEYNEYFSKIKVHVHSFWEIPEWIKKKDLSAKVLVRIDSNGKIKSQNFVKKSTNESFNQAVLNCLTQANPFPKPSSKIGSFIEDIWIEFEFP